MARVEDAAAAATDGRVFSMRIVNLDYYMAAPLVDMDECYSHFLGRAVMEVPVVRIYGPAPSGQKTCLHLHKAFPYFYVPYDYDLPQELDGALVYIRRLALALERAMKMASVLGAKRQHVHCCSLVRARKFYGYHSSEDTFIKIIIYHPQEVSQMGALLLSGAILDRKFQPYEAHIPYLLQLKIDYNLFGMGLIDLSYLRFRSPVPDSPRRRQRLIEQILRSSSSSTEGIETGRIPKDTGTPDFWLSSNISSQYIWSELSQDSSRTTRPSRSSTCELEADATMEAIMNRRSLAYTPLAQTEPGRMMMQSLLPIWEGRNQDDSIFKVRRKLPQKLFATSTSVDVQQKQILKAACESGVETWNGNKQKEESVSSQGSDAGHLLDNSQPANLHEPFRDSQGSSQVNNIAEENDQGVQSEKLNECTQIDQWKGVDDDTLELLKWMVSSQNDDCEEDGRIGDDQAEADLCRLFEGDGVELALQKTLTTYEAVSQRECQEILDCSQEDAEHMDEIGDTGGGRHCKRIPQYDGAGDEEAATSGEKLKTKDLSSARRTPTRNPFAWGSLPITVRGASSPTRSEPTNQEAGTPLTPDYYRGSVQKTKESKTSSEASLRDLMRYKRGRRPVQYNEKRECEDDVDSTEGGKRNSKSPRRVPVGQGEYGALPLMSQVQETRNVEQETEKMESQDFTQEDKEQVSTSHKSEFKDVRNKVTAFQFHQRPPSNSDILASFRTPGLAIEYPGVSYGDYSERPAGCYEAHDDPVSGVPVHIDNAGTVFHLLTPALSPPSFASVSQWLGKERAVLFQSNEPKDIKNHSDVRTPRPASPKYDEMHVLSNDPKDCCESPDVTVLEGSVGETRRQSKEYSQITGSSSAANQVTPTSQTGFRDPAIAGAGQQVTLMSLEILAETRGLLRPDPRYDSISCVVIVIQDDNNLSDLGRETIVLLHDKLSETGKRCFVDGLRGYEIIQFATEVSLLRFLIQLVHAYDPDIILGWEIQRLSIGFLAERAANLGMGLLSRLSRTPPNSADKNNLATAFLFQESENDKKIGAAMVAEVNETIIEDEWGRTHGSGIYIGGRTVLNLWRVMRGELKLGNYTLECVAEAVLKRKVPHISWHDLTKWFTSGPGTSRYRSIVYFVNRATLNLQIVDQLDIINRTAELARVFGIDFYSVFSRGSQYRVESMMLRLAHSQNFLAISPSKEQVAAQPAMECLPLVMEPQSRFYTSPIVVLDFQSLYPSMIIAYNLCFSTCLGKCVSLNPKGLGVSSLWIQPHVLQQLMDKLRITPNGIMFVPPEVVPGVIPRLLLEILSTRIMVKNEMKKLLPSQRVLHRILNARQFALKLIANVTYGYAAAGFSGRMPCAELADSIVQLGRHTLEQAINMVNGNPDWGARVVYGDTDSMFVLLEGRTRDDAFKIGQEIASAVTAANPDPVTLKMEKVYHPCVLLTKKRYVGYSYESPTQSTPTFDAKGIETVRRDSCAAVSKTMEKSLRILFETCDLSKVKHYLQRQWQKIFSGRISVQDFIFSKEVRLGTYSTKASVLPPAAIVATKAMAIDPRAEPCYGERIQYVVIHGEPGARLVDMVVDPYLLLDESKGFRLHDSYYINKQIVPALQRVFGLVGVDLKVWLAEMPRAYQLATNKKPRQQYPKDADSGSEFRRGRIDQYYVSRHCAVCGLLTQGRKQLACQSCSRDQRLLHLVLGGRTSRLERQLQHIQEICNHCGGGESSSRIMCSSLDCAVFFERIKAKREFDNSLTLLENATQQ